MELVVKMLAVWSPQRYILYTWPFNFVNFVIVVMSDIIFIIELHAPSSFNVIVFRPARVARAFRVVSRFPRLRSLVRKAVASFKTILHVLVVLVFWHVLAALLGMQLFKCDARANFIYLLGADGECPECCMLEQCMYTDDQLWDHCPWDEYNHFNKFGPAITLLVFVTTGEGWVEKMEMALRSIASPWPGLIFFMVFYIVSFYLLYNLFIGVILEEFELTDEEKQGLQLSNFRLNLLKEVRMQQQGASKLERFRLRRLIFAGSNLATSSRLTKGEEGGSVLPPKLCAAH